MTTTRASAAEMINRCFRHQHPEAYGYAEASEAQVPEGLRYGRGEAWSPPATESIAEEPMGHPEAIIL